MDQPVEILRGENVTVTTHTVRNGNAEWPISELRPLEIRMLEGKESVGLQIFGMGLLLAVVGFTISGVYGLLIGLFVAFLAPMALRRESICFLLVRPRSARSEMAVIYSNPERKQVQRLMQAIEVARSWPWNEENGGTGPESGDENGKR